MIRSCLPISLLLSAFFLHCGAHAQGVEFFQGSWDEALRNARENGKLVYVDAYTDWCGWCVEMDKRTFSDEAVGKFMLQHFVPVKLDMELGDGLRLAMKYRVTGFPTSLVFDGEGTLLYRRPGFLPPEQFLPMLEQARDPARQLSMSGVSKEIDLPFPDFYRRSMIKGNERAFPTDSTVHSFLDGQPDWTDEVAWSVISRFGGGFEGRQFILENRVKLASLYGNDEVEAKLYEICWTRMSDAAERRSRAGLDSLLGIVPSLFPDRASEVRGWLELKFCEQTENWACVVARVDAILDTAAMPEFSMLNDLAWTMYERCEDEHCLERAAAWMKRVTDEKPEWMYLDTYAALLFKTGRYVPAEEQALRAIEAGTAAGDDTGSTRKLLEKIRDTYRH